MEVWRTGNLTAYDVVQYHMAKVSEKNVAPMFREELFERAET
jgi:hypothetical protein